MRAFPHVERGARPRLERGESPRVIVVGAGVSGCACAAALACQGARVTVLNSALDAVGLPGYGPELEAGADGWAEIGRTIAALPAALREAWLNAASVSEDGAPFLTVDRRAVSIETKRALERIPRLQFRQGLVVDVRVMPAESEWSGGPGQGRVAVETVFGEVIEADAVVLAVGLGLGGSVTVGADVLPGGRYGEIPADGLRKALAAMGVTFREVTMEVGTRFSSRGAALAEALVASRGGCVARATVAARRIKLESGGKWPVGRWSELERARQALQREATRDESDESDGGDGSEGSSDTGARPGGLWPEGYPPAAHWTEGLRTDRIVLHETGSGAPVPLLFPDGIATAESYLCPEGAAAAGLEMEGMGLSAVAMDAPASRLGHVVRALVVANLAPGGRLTLDSLGESWIWAAGRVGGAAGYLESLRSGVRVAEEIAGELARRRVEVPNGCFCSADRTPEDAGGRTAGSGASSGPGVDGESG